LSMTNISQFLLRIELQLEHKFVTLNFRD